MSPRPTTRHELERYAGLFAQRTQVMKSSAMRDLMAITERPEVISLAGGLPDTSTFPPETFARLMDGIARERLAQALQYGPTEGMAAVKGCIAEVMAAEAMRVDPDDLIVTTGGQQVIDLVCKTLIDPGDVIVAEAPTYPGAVPTFCSYQADVVQIEVDDDGMRVDLLDATLDRLEAEGRRPKFIYCIPSFQNPSGVTLSLERRQELVATARRRELLVLEDNPYGLLRYEGEPYPTLRSLDGGDYVIYLGTFSKILSAGLRLGWAAAPRPVLEKMNLGKQAGDLCTSSLTQHFVLAYFQQGDWRRYVDSLIDLYRRRRDTMLDALSEHLPPEARWTRPGGGLFIWATLPDYIDTTDLLARALRENVAFVPGRAAYLDGRGGSSMRLNFSGVTEADIREGVRRIGEVVREQVALYGTLTGHAPVHTAHAPSGRPDGSGVSRGTSPDSGPDVPEAVPEPASRASREPAPAPAPARGVSREARPGATHVAPAEAARPEPAPVVAREARPEFPGPAADAARPDPTPSVSREAQSGPPGPAADAARPDPTPSVSREARPGDIANEVPPASGPQVSREAARLPGTRSPAAPEVDPVRPADEDPAPAAEGVSRERAGSVLPFRRASGR